MIRLQEVHRLLPLIHPQFVLVHSILTFHKDNKSLHISQGRWNKGIAADWLCPVFGVGKDDFSPMCQSPVDGSYWIPVT
jgi:hypothetical protein